MSRIALENNSHSSLSRFTRLSLLIWKSSATHQTLFQLLTLMFCLHSLRSPSKCLPRRLKCLCLCSLALAEQLGADVCLNPQASATPAEVGEWLKASLPPYGPDIVIDCAGFQSTLQASLHLKSEQIPFHAILSTFCTSHSCCAEEILHICSTKLP